jgi:hypothetical protein
MNTGRIAIRRRRRHPRGTVYVAVLAIAMLVLVLGLGGVASARAIARTRNEARDISGARWAALSAIELARNTIEKDPLWRSKHTNGLWMTNVALGEAKVSLDVTNPNGALNRLPTDPVDITATATQGRSAHTARVTLQASTTAYTCLDIPMTAGGAIGATSATVHASGYTIGTNNAFTALLCTINANVEASLTAIGLTVNGTATSLAPARTMPGSNVFDYYLANGTVIAASSLPTRSGARALYRVLLSPTVNPYGSVNASGIYVLDGGNNSITIESCRIVGTLVIINASGAVVLQSTLLAEPNTRSMPCIMIRGDATISCASTTMSEAGATPVNFNPASTPYPWPNGTSNTALTDTYTGAIDGLVYVSGNVTVSSTPAVGMLVVGGGLTLGGTLTLGYTSDYKRSPPPGFAQVVMRPEQGSRKQSVQ